MEAWQTPAPHSYGRPSSKEKKRRVRKQGETETAHEPSDWAAATLSRMLPSLAALDPTPAQDAKSAPAPDAKSLQERIDRFQERIDRDAAERLAKIERAAAEQIDQAFPELRAKAKAESSAHNCAKEELPTKDATRASPSKKVEECVRNDAPPPSSSGNMAKEVACVLLRGTQLSPWASL